MQTSMRLVSYCVNQCGIVFDFSADLASTVQPCNLLLAHANERQATLAEASMKGNKL